MMEKPNKCITRARARELSVKWWETRGRVIEQSEKHPDVCAVNFSIAELEEYLAYVKENSQNVNDPGITIWMGSYAKKEDKPSLSTVFLSPTKKKAPGTYEGDENNFEENEEIDPYNHGQGMWPPGVY
ncbi:hypothetical protein [Christiangramia forsetii]|uniref:Uncharacterized protein n=2 Tax=Christiangramia forsetii TaxID=411153 RepID=A0M390_CHRFK|nr:hypothetical protein [Christiangramia forsetii]GGG26477.1 hypothetical protein GCM10011532_07340 [Christiangramia forsetii]CAL67085.1 hypothetical protein GFO_2120 [Christiangramia forsetii KT0803]